jgi:hypothetical protein
MARIRLPAPPSATQWTLDGELNGGHTISETLAYLSWTADHADEVAAARNVPAFVVSPLDGRLRLSTMIRRWLGR